VAQPGREQDPAEPAPLRPGVDREVVDLTDLGATALEPVDAGDPAVVVLGDQQVLRPEPGQSPPLAEAGEVPAAVGGTGVGGREHVHDPRVVDVGPVGTHGRAGHLGAVGQWPVEPAAEHPEPPVDAVALVGGADDVGGLGVADPDLQAAGEVLPAEPLEPASRAPSTGVHATSSRSTAMSPMAVRPGADGSSTPA
jgi:hypothetical protein